MNDVVKQAAEMVSKASVTGMPELIAHIVSTLEISVRTKGVISDQESRESLFVELSLALSLKSQQPLGELLLRLTGLAGNNSPRPLVFPPDRMPLDNEYIILKRSTLLIKKSAASIGFLGLDGKVYKYTERELKNDLATHRELFHRVNGLLGAVDIGTNVDELVNATATAVSFAREKHLIQSEKNGMARLSPRERELELEDKRLADCVIAAAQFSSLIERYSIPIESFMEGSELSPLSEIIVKFRDGEDVDDVEIEWLEASGIYRFAAAVLYRKFRSGDYWALARASKNLRKANRPRDALVITSQAASDPDLDPRLASAILTTRGGAFRDLSEFDDAVKAGLVASRMSPTSWHPHNLLGAVYCEIGRPEDAMEEFEKAERLGASQSQIDREIRRSVERAAGAARARSVDYLLAKDPVKYNWALRFL